MARKARILQGISRSVLAIDRIQSQPPRDQREPATSSDPSRVEPSVQGVTAPKSPLPFHDPAKVKADTEQELDPALNALLKSAFQASQPSAARIPKILSGPLNPSVAESKLARAAFKTDPIFSGILNAA